MRRHVYTTDSGRHMVEVVERRLGQFIALSGGHVKARGDALEMRSWLVETHRTYHVATLDAPHHGDGEGRPV